MGEIEEGRKAQEFNHWNFSTHDDQIVKYAEWLTKLKKGRKMARQMAEIVGPWTTMTNGSRSSETSGQE